jgi:hypothetical protein
MRWHLQQGPVYNAELTRFTNEDWDVHVSAGNAPAFSGYCGRLRHLKRDKGQANRPDEYSSLSDGKVMKNKVFLLRVDGVSCGAASAGDVYVVPEGAEGGNGTKRQPFTTLSQRAMRSAPRVRRGTAMRRGRCGWAGDYLLSEPFVLGPAIRARDGAPSSIRAKARRRG